MAEGVASGSERRRAGFLSSAQRNFAQSLEYPTKGVAILEK